MKKETDIKKLIDTHKKESISLQYELEDENSMDKRSGMFNQLYVHQTIINILNWILKDKRSINKMIINSHNIEFGYELISVLPYAAYWQKEGQQVKVISGHDMKPFYFFCDFEENSEQREWKNILKLDPEIPNRNIHKKELDKINFFIPDYRKEYGGVYDFDVVVCNKYNNEWPETPELNKPINFFDVGMLAKIFTLLSDYKVAYLNIDTAGDKYYDATKPIPIKDKEMCYIYKNVTHIKDLVKDSFNTTQLQVMAGAKMYITLNGGYAIMASYFGGVNIIYTKW